ncbi:delta(24(24))-sterol reductase [Zalerion maritima]|uniref:Delta(24(24(1)))-sterol reductase n=1 Tax=Zalerion maritima TaxID=339359 RepID=A0AAD5RSD2_9PEZI|nr:delta(24(24))-sterol reductase [Zalerion maritima]
MSGRGRYSLRDTPRKKELYDGMVPTPIRRTSRRKSHIFSESDGENSSAAETPETPETPEAPPQPPKLHTMRRRATGKFMENLDEDGPAASPIDESKTMDAALNGNHKSPSSSSLRPATSANAAASPLANGHYDPTEGKAVIDGWAPGLDPKVDYSGDFEFGGSLGVSAMMIGFPILMWYMWIGATYYDGKVPYREQGQSWGEFGEHLVNLVYTGAFPSLRAWQIYWTFFIFEAVNYCLMPGVWAKGKPLRHEGNKQLPYYCSAYSSFYFTILVMGVLHYTGLFPLYVFIDEFGPLMSVAIISGFLVSVVAYCSALLRGAHHRMTGYPVYDFFMGAELNPRMFGILDFKMFFEVRIPWYILFGLSCGAAARQYEENGYVSGEVMFLVMAHFLYANACSKGEELIVTTWDMYYEKWGFMLIFWNLAGVPLSYCHCTIYLANHHPDEYKWNRYALAALYASYIFAYWIWDTCNSQKNRFRAQERGTLLMRKTFPQLPWQFIENPKKIVTDTGDAILCDGWYGIARKIHYSCDAWFAICWGLITGFNSPFPWFYSVFFCCMIAHRAARDIERCRTKYGDAWKEYEKRVPYLFIPLTNPTHLLFELEVELNIIMAFSAASSWVDCPIPAKLPTRPRKNGGDRSVIPAEDPNMCSLESSKDPWLVSSVRFNFPMGEASLALKCNGRGARDLLAFAGLIEGTLLAGCQVGTILRWRWSQGRLCDEKLL